MSRCTKLIACAVVGLALGTSTAAAQDKAAIARGEKLFMEQGCYGCHTLGKVGTPIAPDLSQIGAKRDHAYLRTWLRDPDLRPEDLRVLEEDGRAVGYCDVAVRNDALYVDLVAPGRWAELLAWAEGEATGRGLGRTSLYVPHEHELADVAAGGGYEKRRESLTMEIALDEPPRDGDFGSLELRTYRDGDRDALIDALNDAFAEDPAHRTVTATPHFRTTGPRLPPACSGPGGDA